MIQDFSSWFVFELFGFQAGDHLAESLNFFVYDSIQVTLLLLVVVFAVSFLRSYISKKKE